MRKARSRNAQAAECECCETPWQEPSSARAETRREAAAALDLKAKQDAAEVYDALMVKQIEDLDCMQEEQEFGPEDDAMSLLGDETRDEPDEDTLLEPDVYPPSGSREGSFLPADESVAAKSRLYKERWRFAMATTTTEPNFQKAVINSNAEIQEQMEV